MVVPPAGPAVTRSSPSGKRCSAISCAGTPSRVASRVASAMAGGRLWIAIPVTGLALIARRSRPDDIAGIQFGGGEREIELRRLERVDAIERLPPLPPPAHALSDTAGPAPVL